MREFICDTCGHKVVVNPKFPPDYTPNICTPCWKQKNDQFDRRLIPALTEFLAMITTGCGPGPALQALQREQKLQAENRAEIENRR